MKSPRSRSVFFFSSRRRHTRCSRDWSSDVCSSDLSSAGALLGQQLAARGYTNSILLGITPEGVEIAANAATAMGAQFDVLVAAFIKLGSNLAPIGAVAESAPSELDPDFLPSGALMGKLEAAIDESRARVRQDLILYRTERPVKRLVGRVGIIVDGQVA